MSITRDEGAGLRARSAILDGEIVLLDRHGKTQFRELLFRRGESRFYAFDLLWCDADLRNLPLIDRKFRLRSVVPQRGERLLFYALTAGTLGCYAASMGESEQPHLSQAQLPC